jgi:RNA polymerase sigma-70 factor (ECF subfamily)
LAVVVQEYCRFRGITASFAIYQHIGGDCRPCLTTVLGMCRDELNTRAHSPREWAPEDVGQEMFSRLLRFAWEPERGSLAGWLRVVIRRIVADLMKAAYRRRTRTVGDWSVNGQSGRADHLFSDEDGGDPLVLAARRELRERVRRAVDSLPFETRQLVTLRFIEGHTLQAISDKLAIPLATVDRRIRKALNDLAGMLNDS